MYVELRDELGNQDYTGMNFDALADSLTDMVVPEEGGVVIALDNFTESRRTDTLLDVLARASRWWLLSGGFLPSSCGRTDPGYRGPDSLGAGQPLWNRREWQDSTRLPL